MWRDKNENVGLSEAVFLEWRLGILLSCIRSPMPLRVATTKGSPFQLAGSRGSDPSGSFLLSCPCWLLNGFYSRHLS